MAGAMKIVNDFDSLSRHSPSAYHLTKFSEFNLESLENTGRITRHLGVPGNRCNAEGKTGECELEHGIN